MAPFQVLHCCHCVPAPISFSGEGGLVRYRLPRGFERTLTGSPDRSVAEARDGARTRYAESVRAYSD